MMIERAGTKVHQKVPLIVGVGEQVSHEAGFQMAASSSAVWLRNHVLLQASTVQLAGIKDIYLPVISFRLKK